MSVIYQFNCITVIHNSFFWVAVMAASASASDRFRKLNTYLELHI